MAAEPEDIPDEEPFSPSIFLNLSPTPPHPGDEQDPAAASSSNSYHQAPQTSTEILSIVSDPCVANTIDVGVGTCFPDTAPVWDGVTWPTTRSSSRRSSFLLRLLLHTQTALDATADSPWA
ncbi:unnamed protein product [Miscanthus lutarioriparius]|uniref:Uncharacterized protein n=1 Tax=Miscanthus lutarioriparius TaxID=422564 RepID=A0A811Q8Z5_9POAL|nr:unnamed protein product [Miscanthus lutarioriparius]CAD6252637.1 unnamed protein product [Miscanthus lutarioriparius]